MNEAPILQRLAPSSFYPRDRIPPQLPRPLLNLNLAFTKAGGGAREATYPSPPMSNSPPPSRPPRSHDQGEDYASILSRPDPTERLRSRRERQQAPPTSEPSSERQPRTTPPFTPAFQSLREPEPPQQLPSIGATTSQSSRTQQGPSSLSHILSGDSARREVQPAQQPPLDKPTKSHTATACQNCRNKHLKCESARPCSRCVTKGLQDTCLDQEHKKRGRPRLRDEVQAPAAGARRHGPIERSQRSFVASPLHSPPEIHHHRIPSSTAPGLRASIAPISFAAPALSSSTISPSTFSPYDPVQGAAPVAFVTLGLFVVKASQSFLTNFGYGPLEVTNRYLTEVIASQDQQKLNSMKSQLEAERQYREPASAHPPEIDSRRNISLVPEGEHIAVCQGSPYHPGELSFILPNGRRKSQRVQWRLAKSSVYFAVLTLMPTSILEIPPRRTSIPYPPPSPLTSLPQGSIPPLDSPVASSPRVGYPFSGSSAPASPYYSATNPAIQRTARQDAVWNPPPYQEHSQRSPPTLPRGSLAPEYGTVQPFQESSRQPPYIPPRRHPRRRESAHAVLERHPITESVQLPPIREMISPRPPPPQLAGTVRRRSDDEPDPRAAAEQEEAEETGSTGPQVRRKRARIDLTEVIN